MGTEKIDNANPDAYGEDGTTAPEAYHEVVTGDAVDDVRKDHVPVEVRNSVTVEQMPPAAVVHTSFRIAAPGQPVRVLQANPQRVRAIVSFMGVPAGCYLGMAGEAAECAFESTAHLVPASATPIVLTLTHDQDVWVGPAIIPDGNPGGTTLVSVTSEYRGL